MTSVTDGIKWDRPRVHIAKYSPEVVREITAFLGYEPTAADLASLAVEPEEILEREGNMIVTGGLGRVTNLITGGGGAAFNSAQAVVGVGATNTAATKADTKLAGDGSSTTAWYQAVDGGNPTIVTTNFTNDTIQAVATFGSSNANFAWNEWCFVVSTGTITAGNALTGSAPGSTGNTMLNRAVQAMGTKVSGAIWVFTGKVTLS